MRFLLEYNSIDDLTLNDWHHIVGTYNGATAELYIDGLLKSSSTSDTFTIAHDATPLAIGYEFTASAKDAHFSGLVDNIMVYNRALAAQEILEHDTDLQP